MRRLVPVLFATLLACAHKASGGAVSLFDETVQEDRAQIAVVLSYEAKGSRQVELVLRLRDQFGLTVVMITHDLDLLWQVTDRVAVLGEGTVQGIGSMAELAQLDRPAIRPFFDGPRARAALAQDQQLQRPAGAASPRTTGPTGEPSSKPK